MARWMLVNRDWLKIGLSVVFRDFWITSYAHLEYIILISRSSTSFICNVAGITDVPRHLAQVTVCRSLTRISAGEVAGIAVSGNLETTSLFGISRFASLESSCLKRMRKYIETMSKTLARASRNRDMRERRELPLVIPRELKVFEATCMSQRRFKETHRGNAVDQGLSTAPGFRNVFGLSLISFWAVVQESATVRQFRVGDAGVLGRVDEASSVPAQNLDCLFDDRYPNPNIETKCSVRRTVGNPRHCGLKSQPPTTTTTPPHPTVVASHTPTMTHILSRLASPFLQALMRLFRCIFGRVRVADAEAGALTPNEAPAAKKDTAINADVPTFTPDVAGVPALALASMSVGAGFASKMVKSVKSMDVPQVIPTIIITPPTDEKDLKLTTERAHKRINVLQATTANTPRRVHGKAPPRKPTKDGKENLALHPNAPRRPQPRPAPVSLYAHPSAARAQPHVPAPSTRAQIAPAPIDSATAQPGSSAWELAKAVQLEQGRKWSAEVTRRHHRRSLPTPPAAPLVRVPLARSASLALARPASAPRPLARAPLQVVSRAPPPVRLPLAERLQRAVAACKPPAVKPVPVPVARLWGDANTPFVLGFEDEDDEEEEEEQQQHKVAHTADTSLASSSSGSLTGILNALEDDLLHSPAWLGRRRFSELEAC
ncbi:hypothetical protein DFH06DRAFT_1448164 [Mycena polygramma]|nr:hypothetical protein DFH06DRAFT_1448164 [Mycena polygramma]